MRGEASGGGQKAHTPHPEPAPTASTIKPINKQSIHQSTKIDQSIGACFVTTEFINNRMWRRLGVKTTTATATTSTPTTALLRPSGSERLKNKYLKLSPHRNLRLSTYFSRCCGLYFVRTRTRGPAHVAPPPLGRRRHPTCSSLTRLKKERKKRGTQRGLPCCRTKRSGCARKPG